MIDKKFKEYYVGRKGKYHNVSVIILATNYDKIQYQDLGLNFDDFEIEIYYLDGSKKSKTLKGNVIKKNLKF